VQKRGKERGPFWIGNSTFLIILGTIVAVALFWSFNRDPGTVTLKLGEVKQILQDPGVVVQNVRFMGRTELRGEIVNRDAISGAGDLAERFQKPVSWRTTIREADPGLQALLDKHVGPGYEVNEEDATVRGISSLIFSALLVLLLTVGAFLMFRWMAGGPSPLTFGRSRHKVYAQKDLKISFADVAGIDEAVAELREVVDFLKKPDKYQALGGRIPKGVLLVGPPGTGKTLLAKAVAGEAEVPFFSLSGSDFVEMFVGVGAARVRDLFSQAEHKAPCIIFIDELDALGKTRSASAVGSHDEREQTLNQLLVEMDGFASNRGVIIMAATNRPEMLDPALLRPGRFDRTVVVDRPDIVGREAILKVHVRNVRLGPDVDLKHVARLTPGSVGADLANLVNEAALMAARGGKPMVTMADLTEAVERVSVGLERKSRIMHEEEKQRTAYHEAGHAVVSCILPNCDPVHKVSIIPRGVGALGYVLSRPEDDRYMMTKSQLDSKIKMALGGTIAEEIVFGEISTGATSDLNQVNNIARRMVKEFGMSPLGRIFFPEHEGPGFLGPGGMLDGQRDYSEQTACAIDGEVRTIIDRATDEVRHILRTRRATLEAVARRLMEKEVLDGDELRGLIAAHTPTPTDIPRPPNPLNQNGHHTNGADHVRTVTVERENGDGKA
jgi:cell division protease FtsH